MSQTGISVSFVCKLCRGSFRQVDEFIEHKKEEHFAEFQKTSSIVFEEREIDHILHPVITDENQQLANIKKEPTIKVEVTDDGSTNPFSSEIIDEPNSGIVEPKTELVTYEREITRDKDKNSCRLTQPEPNPYVLLKRLTSEEIQGACFPKQHFRLLKHEQKNFSHDSDSSSLSVVDSRNTDPNEIEKSEKIQPSATVKNTSTEHDLHLQCKLCSKQLKSDAQLKIHVGICALYHRDRNRYCIQCNRKFSHAGDFQNHCARYHGTEEKKPTIYNFKCHNCPKQYQTGSSLRLHLKSHKDKKQPVKTSGSPSKLFRCPVPNCEKEYVQFHSVRRHHATAHLGVRPYSCSYPNCKATFTQKGHLRDHLFIHTGERPFKCTVNNCNKTFRTSTNRSLHHINVHSDL